MEKTVKNELYGYGSRLGRLHLTENLVRDPGSFRDPSGYVFMEKSRVWRSINAVAEPEFRTVLESGILRKLTDLGLMIPSEPLAETEIPAAFPVGPRGEVPRLLVRHPRIEMLSYPYEWTFSQLKDAALAHLDLQIAAFDLGFVLSDASPYNMQFFDGRIIHIDALSLRAYRPGEIWTGYNQFTRLFLLPLLLEAWRGLPFQQLLRGQIDGIDLTAATKLLPASKRYLSLSGLMHVTLQERANRSGGSSVRGDKAAVTALPSNRYRALLTELRAWVSTLKSARNAPTFWSEYACVNSYSSEMQTTKIKFIQSFVRNAGIRSIWDIGGNTGDYAAAAQAAGATHAVVLDGDLDALEVAYRKRKESFPNLLPMVMDIADPSPALGWNQSERKGLKERANADAVLGLAVLHHMSIGRNIPLKAAIDWFLDVAPQGVIEFVPKTDPMVVQMLRFREDVFVDYDEASFRGYLAARAKVTSEHKFEENGRLMVTFSRY